MSGKRFQIPINSFIQIRNEFYKVTTSEDHYLKVISDYVPSALQLPDSSFIVKVEDKFALNVGQYYEIVIYPNEPPVLEGLFDMQSFMNSLRSAAIIPQSKVSQVLSPSLCEITPTKPASPAIEKPKVSVKESEITPTKPLSPAIEKQQVSVKESEITSPLAPQWIEHVVHNGESFYYSPTFEVYLYNIRQSCYMHEKDLNALLVKCDYSFIVNVINQYSERMFRPIDQESVWATFRTSSRENGKYNVYFRKHNNNIRMIVHDQLTKENHYGNPLSSIQRIRESDIDFSYTIDMIEQTFPTRNYSTSCSPIFIVTIYNFHKSQDLKNRESTGKPERHIASIDKSFFNNVITKYFRNLVYRYGDNKIIINYACNNPTPGLYALQIRSEHGSGSDLNYYKASIEDKYT